MSKASSKAKWYEFECPVCTAENPWDDGFTYGDELFCAYCGAVIEVRPVHDAEEPTYKLRVD